MSRRPTSSLPTKDYERARHADAVAVDTDVYSEEGLDWFRSRFNPTTYKQMIRDRTDLKGPTKAILKELADRCTSTRPILATGETKFPNDRLKGPNHLMAFPGKNMLVADTGYGKRTVDEHLALAVAKGLITVKPGGLKGNDSNYYALAFPGQTYWNWADSAWWRPNRSSAPASDEEPASAGVQEVHPRGAGDAPPKSDRGAGDSARGAGDSARGAGYAPEVEVKFEEEAASRPSVSTEPSPFGTSAEEQEQDLVQEQKAPEHTSTRRPVICYICTGEIDPTTEYDDEDLAPRHTACAERLTARGAA